MEVINNKYPNKCFICKNEAMKKNLDICDTCKQELLADRILCIEAEVNREAYILKGRYFTIHEKDFKEILGEKPNTLNSRFCFMNQKAFNILIKKAKHNSKFELLPLNQNHTHPTKKRALQALK